MYCQDMKYSYTYRDLGTRCCVLRTQSIGTPRPIRFLFEFYKNILQIRKKKLVHVLSLNLPYFKDSSLESSKYYQLITKNSLNYSF